MKSKSINSHDLVTMKDKIQSLKVLGDNIIKKFNDIFEIISPFNTNQLQPASYDVTLGDSIVHNESNDTCIKNGWKQPIINPFLPMKTIRKEISEDGELIEPSKFYNVNTYEYLDLKTINEVLLPFNIGIAADVCGKSSLARLGLVVENAGFIDPGFHGTITLELYNQEKYPILLKKGMPIAQLRFYLVTEISKLYEGKYLKQVKATESKYYLNYTKS
jgi:dCTP deaminase